MKTNEQHAIALLNAAYDRLSDCIKAHERYQCEVSREDVKRAMKELETMKALAAEFVGK